MSRAGLIAVAFVLAAPSPAVAAPAPVPCDDVGGGHHMCSWYVPGDGIHGGALVVVGTTTVGYLHQGRNWVVCQQVGGDVHNAAGDRNNWFGWTTADNGKSGWASPLDASGGDDYGPFGGGTPNCDGAHGSPPTYNGVWGSPPTTAPAPAPVDADRDGVSPPADCDDTNSRVHPGAPEIASDGIDQDCNGADAAGRISGTIRFDYRFSRHWTRVTHLGVSEAPARATISVTCTGKHKGCPRPRTYTASSHGKASMTRLFKHRLRPGAVVTVALSATNTIAKIKRYTIRSGKAPRTRTLCAAPGARPGAC